MNPKILGAVLMVIGAAMIIVNAPLEPFTSDFEGPLVIAFEFAGPLIFSIGTGVFSYQLKSYIKEKEWPEAVPQKRLIASIAIGILASIVIFLYRMG